MTPEVLEKMKTTGYKIIGVKEDDSEVILTTTLPDIGMFEINDIDDIYKKIIIRFNAPLKLSREVLDFKIITYVKADVWDIWKENINTPDQVPREYGMTNMYNTHELIYTRTEGEEFQNWKVGNFSTFTTENVKITS